MMVIMAALGSNWEEGSGKIKAEGRDRGGRLLRAYTWLGGYTVVVSCGITAINPGSSCGVGVNADGREHLL